MGFWIEIRPLRNVGVKRESIREILRILYNYGRPFRFIAISTKNQDPEGTIRFFFEFPDDGMKRYFMNLFTASLNAEVCDEKPPRMSFERCVELELKGHYAYPTINDKAYTTLPINGICSVLADGGAFEVVACSDTDAKIRIHQFIYERTCTGTSLKGTLIDTALNIYREALLQGDGRSMDQRMEHGYRRRWSERLLQREIADAEEKMYEDLFICEIRLYGDRVQVEGMMHALPSGRNRFRAFREIREAVIPAPLKKPRRITFRKILNPLWWIIPAGLVWICWLHGAFNPSRLGILDQAVLIGSAISAITLKLLLRRRNPIILSSTELSTIIGLPTNPGRFPVRFGVSPSSMRRLPSRRISIET